MDHPPFEPDASRRADPDQTLVSVLHLAQPALELSGHQPAKLIEHVFATHPQALGVVIDCGSKGVVLLTPARFHELMARPYFRAVFELRPAQVLADHLGDAPLSAAPTDLLAPVLRAAVERPSRTGFDPILCEVPGHGRVLLDVQRLLVERTKDLAGASEQFEQRQREAQRAARAKSEFIANISHELRTPLNGILSVSEILLDTALDPTQLELVRTLRLSGEALLSQLGDILDISKFEAGHLELDNTTLLLGTVVDEAMQILATRAATAGLVFGATIDPRLDGTMRGDPQRLRQILLNLLGNAIKFTERGEVWACLSLLHEDPHGVQLRIEVLDTGIGIAQELHDRIFEPFEQADSSTSRRSGGIGLGLAICRHIVTGMNGRIGVRSAPGLGSVFWCELTLERVSAPAPDPMLPAVALLTRSTLAGRLLTDTLTRRGSRVRAFAHEDDAIGWARREGAVLCFLFHEYPQGPTTPNADLTQLTLAQPRKGLLQNSAGKPLPTPISDRQLIEHLTGAEAPHEQSTGTRAPAPQPRGQILVVEDHPVNQKVVQTVLERAGWNVTLANNGRDALLVERPERFAAVLMDCQMPEMDGYAATRRWREREQLSNRHAPIIALTASAMAGDRLRCFEAGMDDYLTKPLRREVLCNALDAWTQGAPRQRQLDILRDLARDALTGKRAGDTLLWERTLAAVRGPARQLLGEAELDLEQLAADCPQQVTGR